MTYPAFRTASTAVLPFAAAVTMAVALVGCQPPRATSQVSAPIFLSIPPAGKLAWSGSYSQHIQPIFDRYCVSCHGRDRAENGLRLTNFEEVMRGTQYGAVVVPGLPNGSALVSVVRGTADPSIRMPLGQRRLSDHEVQNLVLWIEAGAFPD